MKSNRISLGVILPLISTAFMVLLEILRTGYGVSMIKLGVLTLLLTLAASYYIRLYEEYIIKSRFTIFILAICYIGSLGLLFFVKNPETDVFWMLGGLLVSMIIDRKLGFFLQFNLIFIYTVGFTMRIETLLHLLVISCLMCALAKYLADKSTFAYGTIIILSTNITLAFVFNNFLFEYNAGFDYLASLINILIVIIVSFLLSTLYNHYLNKDVDRKINLTSDNSDILVNNEEFTKEEGLEDNIEGNIESNVEDNVFGTSYELLMDSNNELLIQLKEHSQELYNHAHRVGDISSRAAKAISADEFLAYTGGLYHEIGKIRPGNYIEQGLLIAEEYQFPEKLKRIVKQHNIKYDKPTSVESTIVMLTDHALATINYLDNQGENKYPIDKVISNIFQLRMEKGTFDEAGLSIKDFKLLRKFYQEEFHKKGMEE